jgi:hypothetical protein
MDAIIGFVAAMALFFGQLYGIGYLYEKFVKKNATVGEVGGWFLLVIFVELIILLAML